MFIYDQSQRSQVRGWHVRSNQNGGRNPASEFMYPLAFFFFISSCPWSLQRASKVTEICSFSCCWFLAFTRCTATVRTTPPGSGSSRTTWNALPAASAPASTPPPWQGLTACRCPGGPAVQLRSARINEGNLPAVEDPWRWSQRGGAGEKQCLIYDCLLPG